ncbi:LuxR C-terminal-related transcriptional regulator [Paenibacillus puldeungensis]|uniref:LuxR C-terminal-related transcriptional regulator n=1 Tax=Paenibacillus puldeungensis TaxID=696536 RepID=A0ABW3RUA5_9BACL
MFNVKGLFILSLVLMFLAVSRIFTEIPMTVIFLVSVVATYYVVIDMIKYGIELEALKKEKLGSDYKKSNFYKRVKILIDILCFIFVIGPILSLIYLRKEIFEYVEHPEKAIDFMSLMSLAIVLLITAAKEVLYKNNTGVLTDREKELVKLMQEGKTNKQIQNEMSISPTRINQLKK